MGDQASRGGHSWEGAGLQGRADGGIQACRGGWLGMTRPADEGSCRRPGLQGRTVGAGGPRPARNGNWG